MYITNELKANIKNNLLHRLDKHINDADTKIAELKYKLTTLILSSAYTTVHQRAELERFMPMEARFELLIEDLYVLVHNMAADKVEKYTIGTNLETQVDLFTVDFSLIRQEIKTSKKYGRSTLALHLGNIKDLMRDPTLMPTCAEILSSFDLVTDLRKKRDHLYRTLNLVLGNTRSLLQAVHELPIIKLALSGYVLRVLDAEQKGQKRKRPFKYTEEEARKQSEEIMAIATLLASTTS